VETDKVIFSAAHPGQGGSGHINCQPKEYWRKRFANNYFEYNEDETRRFVQFMESGYHMGWLSMNCMIFTRVKPDKFGDKNYSVIDAEERPQARRIGEYLSKS
jgi:hypothetical protein